jgi:MYXO-CTERM domain-containing protein
MCVDQRRTDPLRGNSSKLQAFTFGDLDRRGLRSWIALVALTAFAMAVAACSSQGDGAASDDSALSTRWTLPADVLVTGAKVRIAYEDAPKWTGTAACGGALKPGGHKLGQYLLQNFDEVSSVGGYACRRNTADSSRMSVHGTGRALDVFIPTLNGKADNAKGDKVANWLVTHAQRIGVQLVIWDRSIWRANGTNASAYGGPVPHIDHIHVELTNLASALKTPWFSDMSDAPDASSTTTTTTDDGGAGTTTGTTDDAGDTADGGAATDDAGTTGSTGTGSTGSGSTSDAGTKKDASVVDPADDDGAQDAPDADVPAAPGSGAVDPAGSGAPDDGLSSADDEPGETDSLPDVPASKHRTASATDANGDPVPNAGCSTAPSDGAPVHGSTPAGALALALGVAVWLRRKR